MRNNKRCMARRHYLRHCVTSPPTTSHHLGCSKPPPVPGPGRRTIRVDEPPPTQPPQPLVACATLSQPRSHRSGAADPHRGCPHQRRQRQPRRGSQYWDGCGVGRAPGSSSCANRQTSSRNRALEVAANSLLHLASHPQLRPPQRLPPPHSSAPSPPRDIMSRAREP